MKTWNSLSYINLENLFDVSDIQYPNIGEIFEDGPFTKSISVRYSKYHEDDIARRVIHPVSKKYEGNIFLAKVLKQLFLFPIDFIEQCLDEKIDLSKITDKNFQEELKNLLLLKLDSLLLRWIDDIIKKSKIDTENIILSVYIITEGNSVFIFDLTNSLVSPIIKDFVNFVGSFPSNKTNESSFLDVLIGRKNFRPFIYFQEYIDLEKKLE